ncbi:DUF5946 family protein [Promicromonospora vindobonensis]|uniref:DUF5946 family protein n=1 Tax=Promicromonospora vindobonensis TaxID=195748 RepID=A0ABW5VUZ2_9MICO
MTDGTAERADTERADTECADTECAECGAGVRLGSCTDLFHGLLALDHQRLQPWGSFHGLNVACYFLQHPSRTSATVLGGQWHVVTTFLAGGLAAVHALGAEMLRANRRKAGPLPTFDPAPVRSVPAVVTIADLSVDGTFPADGYEARMLEWARSIRAERTPA